MNLEGLKTIHVPFIGTDGDVIDRHLNRAREEFPNAANYVYTAPQHIVNADFDFWTYPEITITL